MPTVGTKSRIVDKVGPSGQERVFPVARREDDGRFLSSFRVYGYDQVLDGLSVYFRDAYDDPGVDWVNVEIGIASFRTGWLYVHLCLVPTPQYESDERTCFLLLACQTNRHFVPGLHHIQHVVQVIGEIDGAVVCETLSTAVLVHASTCVVGAVENGLVCDVVFNHIPTTCS